VPNLQLHIEKLVYGGDGLSRLPADENGRGKTVFLPFVLPGEEVEASIVEGRAGFSRAKVERVLTPSSERVEPGCPYFTRCGGCHYQHIDYAAQLRYKSEILRESLRRTAKFELQNAVVVHSAEPSGYRNRTRMHVRHEPEFALGYFRYGSHALLPVDSCPISSPLINRAIAAVWTLGRRKAVVPDTLHGLQFFANHDDSKLLVELYVRPEEAVGSQPSAAGKKAIGSEPSAVIPGKSAIRPRPSAVGKKAVGSQPSAESQSKPDSHVIESFANKLHGLIPELAGVAAFATSGAEDESRQRAPLTATHSENAQAIGGDSLLYRAAGDDYRVSAGSFFQTNRFLIDKLVEVVVGKHTGRAALDLYAGAGLFTKHLAKNFDEVIAVEASPHSFDDLRHNVPDNVKCVRATTEAFLAERGAKLDFDLVVLDPPRAGLGEKTAKALCRMSASRVTYVSCDPATLSRDVRVLLESGFRVEQAHLVDMFPQTYHMETVLHLAR
jgi:23S rRNA (uracil1939-C5)-methyltransferase